MIERGIRRQEIFHEEMDYQTFLSILKKVVESYEAKVYAYCLMKNHIHLLLETNESEIEKIMQKLAGDYARTYNRKYGCRGPLFEDRYKSCLVKNNSYPVDIETKTMGGQPMISIIGLGDQAVKEAGMLGLFLMNHLRTDRLSLVNILVRKNLPHENIQETIWCLF